MTLHVTITVADDHLADVDAVARAVEAAGVHVSAVLASLGLLSASGDPDAIARLAGVAGVAAVEDATAPYRVRTDPPAR